MILEEKREQGGCCLFPKPWGHLDRPSNSKRTLGFCSHRYLVRIIIGWENKIRRGNFLARRIVQENIIRSMIMWLHAKLPKFPRYLFLFDKTYRSFCVSYTAKTNSRSIPQRHKIYSEPYNKTMTDQDFVAMENAPDSGSMARAPPVKKSLWDEAMPTRDSEYFSWC